MKQYNTFQKALLEAQLQKFADAPEANITDHSKAKALPRLLRNGLIAAAVLLVLTGSIFAAVRFALGGQVEKSIYSIPEYNAENQKYDLSFLEDIALPDAPDEIKEFMVPTAIVGKDDVRYPNCFWEGEDCVWYPHAITVGTVDKIEGKVEHVHTEWNYGDDVISLSQWTAVSITPDKPVISFHFDANAPIKVNYDSFTLDDKEIFRFYWDYSECVEADALEHYNYSQWFWTDGNYLYSLSLPGKLTEEEKLAIFDSIAPAEDIYDYLSIEE